MKKGLIRAMSFFAAFMLSLNMGAFAREAEDNDAVVTRFVVASDAHINEEIPSNQERLAKVFETAYAYAQKQGGSIDAFVFNGDSVEGSFTDGVNLTQWEIFLQEVQKNIREESKFLLTLARTHDIYDSWGTKLRVTEEELNSMIAEAFGTSGDYIAADWGYGSYLTKLNGVAVITLSNDMTNTNNAYNHCNNSREWLKEQLETLVAENPEQPIFVVYHYPEVGALDYSQRWGSFAVSDILDDYPQIIALNAHVHRDPRQARSIWQEDYTEVFDGALAYTSYFDGNNQEVPTYDLSTYAIIEVTASGAVDIKYMNNLTGELLKEGNGSGDTLVYSIPKAWDKTTWNYTYEVRNTTGFPYFGKDASVWLENGNTLLFDRADAEEAMLYYKVEVSDGVKTETYYTGSRFFIDPLPATLSVGVALRDNTTYTATITGVDSLYRETSNSLEYTFKTADSDLKQEKGIAAPAADAITFGTAEEFKAILASGEDYAGKTLVQTADIDLNHEVLTPGAAFKGTLDGNGFTINGLFLKGTALFEQAENALFKNLNLSGTVIGAGDAAALAGNAVNCTFENCMNGAVMIALSGKAASYAARLENTVFKNCIFDGSLKGAETEENQSTLSSSDAVTVQENQLIFHTENGDIKRSLKDGGRGVDWNFDTAIGSAEEFINWLLGGAPEAMLECDIDLGKLHGRMAVIAGLGLEFEAALNGNYCVIRGGKMSLTGDVKDLGATDMALEGENCWDADDFTPEELESGAAAYRLGTWGQYENTPAGNGKVVKITAGDRVDYVNVGTVYEVEVPYGYSADRTSFTAEADTVVTLTAHAADKTFLGELHAEVAQMNPQAFTQPASFEAALAAAEGVLKDASAAQSAVDQAIETLKSSLKALVLAEDEKNYPAVSLHEIYQQFFEVTKWSVNDLADLQAWSAWSKNHNGAGMEFHMTADIDMQNVNFGMIGRNEVPFRGRFDGHLHTVSNLLIDDTSGTGTGFFVYISNGDIRNFGIESGTVIGYVTNRTYPAAGCSYEDLNGVAAIAGRADGTKFRHVWNRADVTHPYMLSIGNSCFAGLVSRAQLGTSFVGCYNTGDVYGKHRASGITNWAQCTTNMARISNCFNIGRIYTEESAENYCVNAIALYDDPQSSDNTYFSYNNYWLAGCAETGTSRDTVTNGYNVKGAEAPKALSAKEINTDLAGLLNDGKYTGYYADTATWVQGEDGYPVIASLYDGDEDGPWPLAEFEAHPDARGFTISTPAELNKLATLSKSQNFAGYTFVLLNNIDMSGTASFAMIGAGDPETATGKDTTKVFAGTFDGQGYTISGLNISSTSTWGGFFAALKNATVKNFTLSGVKMTGARYSGMLVGKICNSTIEDVHVVSSTFTANGTYNTCGGLVGYIYNQERGGGLTVLRRCSLEGSAIQAANNGGVGGLIGEMAEATVTDCYVINNTINALNASGLLLGYCYIGTVEGCFTYGNTLKVTQTDLASGAAVGRFWYGGKSYFNDSIFCEKELNIYGCFQSTNDPIFDNTYSLYATPTEGIAATEAQLSSGELAYLTGKAMKNGKLAVANATTLAAHKNTYKVDDAVYAVRYTDYTGAQIGTVEDPVADFAGWYRTADGENGDQLFAAFSNYDTSATYPMAMFEYYPKARSFTLSTPEDLNKLAALSKGTNFAGYTFTLLKDIDMSGTASFAMIGAGDPETATGKDTTKVFAGTFDGQGHTISGLNISSTSTWGGFFAALKNATVKNFTLSGVNMTGARYSGMLVGKICNSIVEDVHVVNSTFAAYGTYNTCGGLVGYIYNQERGGGLTVLRRCSLEGSTIQAANNGGVGGLIGEMAEATVTDCYVINNTINALNASGLLLGYCYIGTVEGCFTYGNTLKVTQTDLASGAAVGRFWYGGKSYFNDSIFCEKELNIYGCFQSTNDPIFDNTYSLYATPTEGIAATEAQLNSGELAYLTGKAMKNGKLAVANTTTLAAHKNTYKVNDAVYAVRYTDSTGAQIGTVEDPTKMDYNFIKWTETADGTLGDKLLTAIFELKPAWIYVVEGETIATFYANTANEYTAPADPTKDGYLFVQWNATVEGKNTTYTAEFKQNFSVNGDEAVDLTDVILLLQHLVGYDVAIDLACADVNKDGRVSIFDAVKLLQYYSSLA